jgi:hypothetical protein
MNEITEELPRHIEADPPLYFKRLWNPDASHPDDEVVAFRKVGGDLLIWTGRQRDIPEDYTVDPEGSRAGIYHEPLLIYGRKIKSRYPEDQDYLRRLEAEGCIFTESFSIACVEGEIGSQPLGELTEIDKEEFEEARERGWT